MILTVSAVSTLAYLVALIGFRRKRVEQQVAFLIVFLAGTAVIGELDVLLPIYFVFSFLPFVPRIRKLSSFTAFISLYLLIYLFVGLAFQNPTRTLVTFIAKMWQFVVFFIICDENISLGDPDYKPVLWIAILAETALGFYLMFTSTIIDSLNGLVRLVNNGQPITGNIATFALPLSAYYYMKNRDSSKNTRFLLFANLYYLIWIVLSGTRGYTMEYVAVMGFIFYDYFVNSRVGATTQRNRIVTLLTIAAFGIILVVVVPGILEKASSVLRLKSSVGIRTFENAAVKDFIKDAPLTEVIFGIGLGGTGSEHEAMRNALYKQFSLGMWNRNHYILESGTLFHSLYSNITMCLGLLGILITIMIFINMWKRVTIACRDNVFIRRIMHAFQISFFLMNYYRWSADCGIAEMILFALILKLISSQEAETEIAY